MTLEPSNLEKKLWGIYMLPATWLVKGVCADNTNPYGGLLLLAMAVVPPIFWMVAITAVMAIISRLI